MEIMTSNMFDITPEVISPSSSNALTLYHEFHHRKIRIALYSHDTMGLGHVRRNHLIAQVLARSDLQPVILLINGVHEANTFEMPQGVDCLSLPALSKQTSGDYTSRSLDLPLQELIAMRSNAILGALEAFMPDILIVDKVPRGAYKELDPTLEFLSSGGSTRCILGLRDILDDPAAIQREWLNERNEEAILNYYDAIWVYGDPSIFNLVNEYQFSHEVTAKVRYTGYFDQSTRLAWSGNEETEWFNDLLQGPLILCLVGGGQDGAHLAEAFAHAELPSESIGIILTGPFMPRKVRQYLHHHAHQNPRLYVLDFINEPAFLIHHADRIIAMGGYNTICEVLSFRKRALIVPRVRPRTEQLIRANRMRDMGIIDLLHPDDLTPNALTQWLVSDLPPVDTYDRIDFNGLKRIPYLIKEVI